MKPFLFFIIYFGFLIAHGANLPALPPPKGYAPMPGQICGAPLQEALAQELGKHFCLQVLDPACLYRSARKSVMFSSPTEDLVYGRRYLRLQSTTSAGGLSNNNESDRDFIKRTMNHLTSRHHLSADGEGSVARPGKNYLQNVGSSWVAQQSEGSNSVYNTLVPNGRYPVQTDRLVISPNMESILGTLASIIVSGAANTFVGAAVGVGQGIYDMINIDTANTEVKTDDSCPGDIPSIIGIPDCKPTFEINTRKARNLLRSANSFSTSPPQSEWDARLNCSYLNQMLYTLHTKNVAAERALILSAPLQGYPRCNGSGGAILNYKSKNRFGADVTSQFTYSGFNKVPQLKLDTRTEPLTMVGSMSEPIVDSLTLSYRARAPVFLEAANHPLGNTEVLNSTNQLNGAPVTAAYVAACCQQSPQDPQSCFDKFLKVDRVNAADVENSNGADNAESL